MAEADQEVVAPRPAATVMLIDDRPDLQVFMLKRSAATVFGGMWVFPGGTVDEEDHPGAFEAHCAERSDLDASRRMELPQGGLAYFVAAIREAFEEAGILLARHRDTGAPLALTSEAAKARFDQYRHAINHGQRDFLSVIDDEALVLDTGAIHYCARWITPAGAPKRFDTRFFVARMPRTQDPIHDEVELTHSGWFNPARLLRDVKEQSTAVMPPTQRMLEALAAFDSSEAVMAAASRERPALRIPMSGGQARAIPAEPGWVYLRPDD